MQWLCLYSHSWLPPKTPALQLRVLAPNNQKHLKPDALKKWRKNWRSHFMSLPDRVFLQGPGPWRAMQKEPLYICWKMESWSKNTKEGTETFQKRQGSGPRNKKEEDKILVWKKKRNGNWIFFTKQVQKLPPLPWLLHQKRGKQSMGNSSEKKKCLHCYSWEFKQSELKSWAISWLKVCWSWKSFSQKHPPLPPQRGTLRLRGRWALSGSQTYQGSETGQKVVSWHLSCALFSGLPYQYDVFIALNWHLSFGVSSVPGSHPSPWFSERGPQAAAAPKDLSEIHILCPTPGLWNQKPQAAEASLNKPTREFWGTEAGGLLMQEYPLYALY